MEMRLKVEEPGKIIYTLTATAPAAEWDKFREALEFVAMKSMNVPQAVHDFRRQIDDMLGQARKIYWPNAPKPVCARCKSPDHHASDCPENGS